MSDIQAYDKEIYNKLGGLSSFLFPITHIGFFIYILSRQYIKDINNDELRNKCNILFAIELLFIAFIIGDIFI